MKTEQIECRVEERQRQEKMIACVQVCLRCRKELPFKQGRKSCPYCQGLLATKTVVRIPNS